MQFKLGQKVSLKEYPKELFGVIVRENYADPDDDTFENCIDGAYVDVSREDEQPGGGIDDSWIEKTCDLIPYRRTLKEAME